MDGLEPKYLIKLLNYSKIGSTGLPTRMASICPAIFGSLNRVDRLFGQIWCKLVIWYLEKTGPLNGLAI